MHVHVDVYMYMYTVHVHVSMRDGKEGRNKQARSKKQGKATQHTQGSQFSHEKELPRVGLKPTTLYTLDRMLYQLSYQGSSAGWAMYMYIVHVTLTGKVFGKFLLDPLALLKDGTALLLRGPRLCRPADKEDTQCTRTVQLTRNLNASKKKLASK